MQGSVALACRRDSRDGWQMVGNVVLIPFVDIAYAFDDIVVVLQVDG